MGPWHHLSFGTCKTACLASELLVSMGPSPHVWFLDAKQRLLDRINKSLWVPYITCRFVHAKRHDLQQNDKSIWVPALICVFLICKTATLGPDLQVCMCPRPHLWFWAHITAWLAQEWKDYMGSSPHVWFCACKSATLAPELLVSIGPSPHLRFLYAKQRNLDQHPSLYGYHTSLVVLYAQNNVISIRITSLYRSQPSSVVFIFKTAHYGPELLVPIGPRPHLSYCACKTAWLASEILVSMGPCPHAWFLDANSDFCTGITSLYESQT